jgi:hypothetical protein
MEHPEDPTRAKEEAEAEAERATHKHPASGIGSGAGFAKGAPGHPDDAGAEERPAPDFARGARHGEETQEEHRGRFSEGIEQEPEDAPDKAVERRFSEGIEESPTSD